MNIRTIPFISVLAFLPQLLSAQKQLVERRDQAQGWYLPVKTQVTINGGKAKEFSVVLYKDNEQITELPPCKRSAFELGLDIDANYTIIIRKEGYLEKMVSIDTHLPESQIKYGPFECFVNLEPADRFAHSDPFYLDFPSALVKWDDSTQAFVHSDEYLADIQLKVALLGAQVDAQ